MADYWKSQPRKFCDFCKCWITDNKPSVEFHERGKRHKENVQKRIDEMRKRSAEKAKEQAEMDEDMAKMEKAAMEALKRDIARDPSLAAQYGIKLKPAGPQNKPEATSKEEKAETSEKPEDAAPVKVKEWFEAKSPEGYSYYWNISTNETQWEPPVEYVSLAEQEGQTTAEGQEQELEQAQTETQAEEPGQSTSAEEPEVEEPPAKTFRIDPVGPRSAYGAWETVRQEPAPEPEPEVPAEVPVEAIPLPGEIPEAPPEQAEPHFVKKDRFKEKTVTSLGPTTGNIGFKKRKIASGARNMRQRDTDD